MESNRDGRAQAMSAIPLPLKFQIGARTLFVVRRRLVRLALTLDEARAGAPVALPPLAPGADGYVVTSLPEAQLAALARVDGGMILRVRQRYTHYYVDLTIGLDAYLAALSSGSRSGIKRKIKKLAAASGGAIDCRCYRTPEEITTFHAAARAISARTYQEQLLGSGLPDDPAFVQAMLTCAAAGEVRGWLLHIGDRPVAYLYCPIIGGNVRYEYVGHDPDYADMSPGSVLQMQALSDLFGEGGHRQFDFTEGEGQHKRQFATGGVACVDLLLLRPTFANRALVAALGGFDRMMAIGKRLVDRFGWQRAAKRLRR